MSAAGSLAIIGMGWRAAVAPGMFECAGADNRDVVAVALADAGIVAGGRITMTGSLDRAARSLVSGEADRAVAREDDAALVLRRLDDAERDGDRIYAVIREWGGSSTVVPAVVRAALALFHRVLPTDLDAARPWIHAGPSPRRVEVAGLVVLEEHADSADALHPGALLRWETEAILISADDRDGLAGRVRDLVAWLRDRPGAILKDLAYTMNCSDEHPEGAVRLGLVASSAEDLSARLSAVLKRLDDPVRPTIGDGRGVYHWDEPLGGSGGLAFLFPGEGSQYPGMLADLCIHFPEVRQQFDIADRIALDQGDAVRPSEQLSGGEALWSATTAVNLILNAQWALYQILTRLGLEPDAVVGHSSGEILALAAAGVLRTDEQLERQLGRLGAIFRDLESAGDMPAARLVAIAADRDRAEAACRAVGVEGVTIAIDNCPHQVVLAGPPAEVDRVADHLRAGNVLVEVLPFDRPYHTRDFAAVLGPIAESFARLTFRSPALPVYSCATRGRMPDHPESIRTLAVSQWTRTVAFRETIEAMHADGLRIFVDVGARGNLAGFVQDILRGRSAFAIATNLPRRSGLTQLNHLVAALFAQGVAIRPGFLYARRRPRRIEWQASERAARSLVAMAPLESRLQAESSPRIRIPAEAGTPTTAPLESRLPAESSPRIRIPAEGGTPTTAPLESRLPAESSPHIRIPAEGGTPTTAPLESRLPAESSPHIRIPAEAGTPTTAPLESRLPAESSPHIRIPAEGGTPTTAPLESRLQAESSPHIRIPAEGGTPTTAPLESRLQAESSPHIRIPAEAGTPATTAPLESRLQPESDWEDRLKPVLQLSDEAHEVDATMLAFQETMRAFLETQQAVIGAYLGVSGDVEMSGDMGITPGPWVGEVRRLVPGSEVESVRVLDVRNDPIAEHHTLGGRKVSAIDPTLKGLPVLPFAVMAEMAAQAAAMIVSPGLVLVKLVQVKAHKWVRYEDEPVVVELRGWREPGSEPGEERARVALFNRGPGGRSEPTRPVFEAVAAFADATPAPPPSDPWVLEDARPSRFTAASIYDEQWLFHGPAMQAVSEVGRISSTGIDGALRVLPWEPLLDPVADRPARLHTDIIVIDSFTHLLGCWGLDELADRGDVVFPLHLAELEFFGDRPAVGTDVACRIAIRELQRHRVRVGVDIVRPDGTVWMRLHDWEDWRFHWPGRYRDVFRQPRDHFIGEEWPLPSANPRIKAVWLAPPADMGRPVWRDVLEQTQLGPAELAAHLADGGSEEVRSRRAWASIAGKEAARRILLDQGHAPIYPADLAVVSERGRFVLTRVDSPGDRSLPAIAIADAEGVAVAIATNDPHSRLGISIATITDRDEWAARLECAREAAIRASGAESAEVVRVDESGGAVIVRAGDLLRVATGRRGEYAWAWTLYGGDET